MTILNDNTIQILRERYLLKDKNGEVIENHDISHCII